MISDVPKETRTFPQLPGETFRIKPATLEAECKIRVSCHSPAASWFQLHVISIQIAIFSPFLPFLGSYDLSVKKTGPGSVTKFLLVCVTALHLSWVPMQVHYGSQVGCGWIKQSPPLLHFHHLLRTSGIFRTTNLYFSISDLVVAIRAWPKRKHHKQNNQTVPVIYSTMKTHYIKLLSFLAPSTKPPQRKALRSSFRFCDMPLEYHPGLAPWPLPTSWQKLMICFHLALKLMFLGGNMGQLRKPNDNRNNRNMKPNTSERYSIILNECGVNEHIPILCIKIMFACKIVFLQKYLWSSYLKIRD